MMTEIEKKSFETQRTPSEWMRMALRAVLLVPTEESPVKPWKLHEKKEDENKTESTVDNPQAV